jgi:hypothetical protein
VSVGEEKEVKKLSVREIEEMKKAVVSALTIYGKEDPNMKLEGLRILNGWGRIIFIISNDGKRIGLELTERWERERFTEKGEKDVS